MRLFKVMRMKRVKILDENFSESAITDVAVSDLQLCIADENVKNTNDKAVNTESVNHKEVHAEIHLLIDKTEAYRVYDRFEEENITVLKNGDFLIKSWYLIDDWVYGMILSFGSAAEVLEPAFVRDEVRHRIADMQKRYAENL